MGKYVQFAVPGAVIWVEQTSFWINSVLFQQIGNVLLERHCSSMRVDALLVENVDGQVNKLFESLVCC